MCFVKLTLLTIFPHLFDSLLANPVIDRAIRNGLVEIDVVDIRSHTDGCFRAIDDSPYGGGAGLLLRVDALSRALDAVHGPSSRTILLGPEGRTFTQDMAHELACEEHVILVAGHYEGVDARFMSRVDDEVSIGDYILTGGESAATVVAEAVIRLLDGALRGESSIEESFENGLLEHPQYTHPVEYDGMRVPDVLMSGDREEIARFNELESIKDTIRLRPDLLPRDQEFRFFSLHRDYGYEAQVISWLGGRIPVPTVVHEEGRYLLLDRLKGRRLRGSSRNKVLGTCAHVLGMLWSMDTSGCPCLKDIQCTLADLKGRSMAYGLWCTVDRLERMTVEEELVFSHGALTLDNIIVNGNGLVGMLDLRQAGLADRHRDLASLLVSLEEEGIDGRDLIDMLEVEVDEEKLAYFTQLGRLERSRLSSGTSCISLSGKKRSSSEE